MNKVKTIFIGSGEFAPPILKKLTEIDFIDLVAVVTQPDKPVGRKQILEPTPLGKFAEELSLNLLKPVKIREVANELLEKYEPELIIVASYGQMIPNSILEYPKYGCLNLHGSILPELRGAVPVQMAILKGLKETGVSLQIMAEKLDEGDVIAMHKLIIGKKDDSETLMLKLANQAAANLEKDLTTWIEERPAPLVQDNELATYCSKDDLSKENAEITFETDVELAARMVRAFYPWPITWIKLPDGKILKIYKSTIKEQGVTNNELRVKRDGKSLILDLKNGSLELLEVQIEGKKRRPSSDYLFLAN